MNLRRTIIFAKDMKRMTSFYRDALALQFLPDRSNEQWSEFQAGGVLLALHAIPAEIARDIQISGTPTPRSGAAVKLVFEVADLEVARLHLIAHGAVMSQARDWGACDGVDPEGNVFQIVKS
jgi:hypothetical protein